jgi:hypothetical protein
MLTFTELHGVISQNIVLFKNATAHKLNVYMLSFRICHLVEDESIAIGGGAHVR